MRALSALALSLSLSGCFAIGSQEITVEKAPPLPFSVDDENITITEGTALVARIAVLDEDDYLIDPADVTWSVDNTNASITTTAFAGIYVITGVRAGTAILDGERAAAGGDAIIHVTITPQTPP